MKYYKPGLFIILFSLIFMHQIWGAEKYKVLIVMSYDETYPFESEMRDGINSGLKNTCELTYFYLNTKNDFENGPQRAEEAYILYQNLKPDGVIAADDDAQAMFVVPFLKDQVETPVMFCGVNADPKEYGYPATNVSGILERGHIRESLSLVQQLVPGISTYGRIIKDSPMARAALQSNIREVEAAGLTYINAKLPQTLHEALALAEKFKSECDVIMVSTLQGILDENGESMTNRTAISRIVKAFGKPTIGSTFSDVQDGALCAVIQSGKEQGRTAADMLLAAMEGKPVSQIPITQNKYGRRIINVDTMNDLCIEPKPIVIRNAELVRTEE